MEMLQSSTYFFFKQQVPSPYNPLKLIPKSFLVSPVRFSFRWTLNFISWTLLERLQGNNKRSVLTSSNTGLIMLIQFFSRFKKECNKMCFFPQNEIILKLSERLIVDKQNSTSNLCGVSFHLIKGYIRGVSSLFYDTLISSKRI